MKTKFYYKRRFRTGDGAQLCEVSGTEAVKYAKEELKAWEEIQDADDAHHPLWAVDPSLVVFSWTELMDQGKRYEVLVEDLIMASKYKVKDRSMTPEWTALSSPEMSRWRIKRGVWSHDKGCWE
jgi:hypothetical protein